MEFDKDLYAIQQARNMVSRAKTAQKTLRNYTQTEIDDLVKTIAHACESQSERLARLAWEETGFGNWQDKKLKNLLGSKMVYEAIKDLKTVGIIKEDEERKVMEVGVPVGVIAALIPSTNPTSTTMFKALISIKAGNSIVISPHPNARNCIEETVKVIKEAAETVGAPADLIQVLDVPAMEGTKALMTHEDTGMILATGGEAMVKAAYCSGNPALGVGPGNGPAYIEKTANIQMAVKHILDSKTFDNGTICASEQSIVTEDGICGQVIEELKGQGAYFLNTEESKRVEKLIMRSNNTMNPAIVGKSAVQIGQMAGINLPQGCRVIVSEQTEIGRNYPFSREKLCPILGFYTASGWQEACEICIRILENEGAGHTMTIHTEDEQVIREFALKKPISRLLINTPAALGGVGATTNLLPSLTLGCGAVGGSATSDNVGPLNLINIRRVAYGVKELEELKKDEPPLKEDFCQEDKTITPVEIEAITKEVLRNILSQRTMG